MSTEIYNRRRFRLWLGLLFVGSFALSLLALRPSAVQSLVASVPPESMQEFVRTTLVTRADMPVESIAIADEPELPVAAVSTLQDLAADSDLETRMEAQALLALVDEEAGADWY